MGRMMLKRCPNCDSTKLSRATVRRVRHVAGHAFEAKLPAQKCGACGESYFADADVEAFDLLVAARLAGSGVTHAEALQFMRKATGLRSKEFAELLEVRPETVSRWEQAKRPIDRATFAIIHQLIQDRLHGSTATADFLRSLHRPRRLPRQVRLSVDDAA